ncbi:transcriptional regulator, LysR family [Roseivivax lentus]|uniref:Transcriptional regulator, LysR family n=1 Tax=Roseivivax lentus TaxID=633194 RepID=A0A1N7NAG2_9RHOB|nr:LysR family transcriptional regulator [Roseivivax lentus]SIS95296.1 transcriptional regulator, LysR family [Roseivivax lentus]
MDTELLRTVSLVAQQGSFAAAARVLNVDPSSVSRAVAAAEAALGLRLFRRTTRSLTVTEEGEIYLRRIAPLLEELDAAREAATQAQRAPSGTLRMTASVAFAHECIVPHLGAFHALYPDVSVELLPTDANLDIAANAVDLAIRLGAAPAGDLISTRLLTTRYVVCVSPGYVATHPPVRKPEDLAAHDCLRFALPEFRTRWRFRRPGGTPFEVPVSGRTIIANALSLRRAALDGLGPVLLADWLVGRDLSAGRLVDLFPDHDATATDFDTGAFALYPSRAFLPRKVRAMIDFLRDRLGN